MYLYLFNVHHLTSAVLQTMCIENFVESPCVWIFLLFLFVFAVDFRKSISDSEETSWIDIAKASTIWFLQVFCQRLDNILTRSYKYNR